ncbi:hypothetical protein BKA56DRAFT_600682 [Ilyonectria sp. MPI-CAGE-AT-0026]|nr:hypothetical protein BKA56DRAFT_600682 [Ilyonectria sp. MPI-CAGE-AT-0026]
MTVFPRQLTIFPTPHRANSISLETTYNPTPSHQRDQKKSPSRPDRPNFTDLTTFLTSSKTSIAITVLPLSRKALQRSKISMESLD